MRREITCSYGHDDLIKRLDLPKSSVILSVFTQTIQTNPRQFCFKISVEERELEKYLDKIEKQREEGERAE